MLINDKLMLTLASLSMLSYSKVEKFWYSRDQIDRARNLKGVKDIYIMKLQISCKLQIINRIYIFSKTIGCPLDTK